ncbi:MAG: class I SAM-dependent methyltransferase [Candidatus Nanopelagicales bacterium]
MSEIESQVEELVGRLFLGGVAAFELLTIHLGKELGLYAALAHNGGATAPGLAGAAGIDPRYAREWLEQQAVAGLIDVDNAEQSPDDRTYRLSTAHAQVLLDEESLAYVAPFGGLVASLGEVMPRLVAAYRAGTGIRFGDYGPYLRDGQGAFNRPAFTSALAAEWIRVGLPDLHERLLREPAATVLDVGCGYGWSSVALAAAYPRVNVVGIDLDEPSIEAATRHAKQTRVDDRVDFRVADAADPELSGHFDAVFVFEALHDMARPVEVLAAIRNARAEGGTVVIMDERVAEQFSAPGDEIERFMYSASVLHCLPVGMAEQPTAATGTVMRADTLREYASAAGYTDVEILPIHHDFFRFYRLSG